MPIVQGPKHAVETFGLDNSVFFNNYPVHKFMFAVKFNFNPLINTGLDEEELVLIVKNVKIGGISIETGEENQYNRSRLIHNKLKFDDTTLVLHDVADGKSMRLWKVYYEYYFQDGKNRNAYGYDTTKILDDKTRYLIESVDIYQFHAGRAIRTELKNPKIVKFDHDSPDYSSLEGLMEMTFSIKPEYIVYYPSEIIPEFIIKKLQLGTTPDDLEGVFTADFLNSIASDPLFETGELFAGARSDLLNSLPQRVLDAISGQQLNPTVLANTIAGSLGVPSSLSVLDSLGALSSIPLRTLPPLSDLPNSIPIPGSIIPSNPLVVDLLNTTTGVIGSVIDGDQQGGGP